MVRRVLLPVLIPCAVGALLMRRGHVAAGGVALGLGLALGLCARLAPALFRRLEKGGRWMGMTAGVVLTWLLLVPLFYGVFSAGRLILLALGRDPMSRQFPTGLPSYWITRKPADRPDTYKRQY